MLRSLLLASAAAVLALPAAAGASSVTAVTPPGASVPLTTFTGGPGVNDVTFTGHLSSVFAWTDAAQPLKAKAGCTAGTPVICLPGNAQVNLGGGDDRFDNPFSDGFVTVDGGGGADTISANGNATLVDGGSGGDTIDVNANGNPVAHGEGGDDAVRGGLNNVLKTTLTGDGGDDLVVGWSRGDDLSGGSDADQLLSTNGRGKADGGGGPDVIVNLGVNPSGFTALGGGGADTIVGTPDGADTVDAGAGADVIDVSGAGSDPEFPISDTVTCGDGRDTVYADADDTVAADCERVLSGPAPALPGVAAAIDHLKAAFPDNPTGAY